MEMLIPFGVVDLLSRPRRDPLGILLGVLVLLPIASVLLSGSRGGMVALIVEILVLVSVMLAGGPRHARRRLTGKLVAGIVVAAFVFFWMDAGGAWLQLKIAFEVPYSSQAQLTFADRKAASLDCLRIFRDHPWLGTGLGSFDSVFPRYQSFATGYNWTPAHNDYAQMLAETGLVGGLVTLWALAVFLFRERIGIADIHYKLGRHLRSSRSSPGPSLGPSRFFRNCGSKEFPQEPKGVTIKEAEMKTASWVILLVAGALTLLVFVYQPESLVNSAS